MDQPLSSYKIFKTVAEEGSFLQAAQALFISQPAVSKSIKKLEDALEVQLFFREARGVRLTVDGEILYEHIQNAFNSIDTAKETIRQRNILGIGSLRIGTSATLCRYVLLPYLNDFVSKNPHIQISIQCQSTADTIALLNNGKIDLGLVGITDEQVTEQFHFLKDTHYVFVATSEYLTRLCQRGINTTYDILTKGNIMLLDSQNVSRLHIEKYFAESGIHPANILEVNNMDLLIDFAKIGIGIACVIKEFVIDDLENGSFVEVKLKKPVAPRKIGIATGKKTTNHESAQRFLETLPGYRVR